MRRTAKLALVGDRSPLVRSHVRVPAILDSLRREHGLALDAYWVGTDQVGVTSLDRFDAVWLLPGGPYRSEAGAILAARTAREEGIPFLGTCAGFQHALLEYARNVCGIADAVTEESSPEAGDAVISALSCSLVGHEGSLTLTPGSTAEALLGVDRTVERYHCSYGLNPDYADALEAHGMRFTGHDGQDVRIAELPGHPFFLATLFQPELSGESGHCHPLVIGFAEAAIRRAGQGLVDGPGHVGVTATRTAPAS